MQGKQFNELPAELGAVDRLIKKQVQMPAAAETRPVQGRSRQSRASEDGKDLVQLRFLVIFAVGINIENSVPAGVTSPAADK